MKIGDKVKGSGNLPDGTVVDTDFWVAGPYKIRNGGVDYGDGASEIALNNVVFTVVSLPPTITDLQTPATGLIGSTPTWNDLTPDSTSEQEVTYKLVVTLGNGGEDTYTFDEDCDIETENGELTICTDGVFAAVYAPGEWKSAVRKEIKS